MVATPPTLESLLHKTAQLISAADEAGKLSTRMKTEAQRLNQRLTNYHYTVECKRQELTAMAQKFLDKWCDWERDSSG